MSDPILAVRTLSYWYGTTQVLHDITFSVERGEMIGIIGPNGTGKSTLLRLFSGFLKPQNGSIELLGRSLDEYGKRELARHVATMPQGIEMSFPFTVEEFLLMARYPHYDGRFSYEKEEKLKVREFMASTDIGDLSGRTVTTLSEGERQKVYLAQCIVQETDVLLLDEPVSHLDIRHQLRSLEALEDLHNRGLTILMVLHDLNLASEFCSRILFLAKGRVFADGAPHDTLTYKTIEEAYGAVVIVKENPVSGKPFILPVSKKYLKK